MGLLTIIRKQKAKDSSLRILILGLDNAGKTTVLKRLIGEDISQVSPTLGFNIKTIQFGIYRIDLWDVGGQRSLRSYWRNYFESTDALVWVVDSTDRLRLDNCRRELHGLLLEERLMGADLLVLINKTDIAGRASSEEISELLDLQSIKTHRWRLFEVSAVDGKNVKESFAYIADAAAERKLG
ncbi:hypothetical protein PYCC9005_002249 [Savitreella phatthalungensis]